MDLYVVGWAVQSAADGNIKYGTALTLQPSYEAALKNAADEARVMLPSPAYCNHSVIAQKVDNAIAFGDHVVTVNIQSAGEVSELGRLKAKMSRIRAAALQSLEKHEGSHIYAGDCPERKQIDSRDGDCPLCRLFVELETP